MPDDGVVHGQHDRADLDLVALLDLDFLDDAGHRRGHLDGGLVGLELEDRLLARDRVADVHEHFGHVAAGDVFAQLGDFELCHSIGQSRSRPFRDPPMPEPDCRVRLLGVDPQILDGLLRDRRLQLAVARQLVQRRQHDVLGVDLEEVAQRRAALAAAEAIGAERGERAAASSDRSRRAAP